MAPLFPPPMVEAYGWRRASVITTTNPGPAQPTVNLLVLISSLSHQFIIPSVV